MLEKKKSFLRSQESMLKIYVQFKDAPCINAFADFGKSTVLCTSRRNLSAYVLTNNFNQLIGKLLKHFNEKLSVIPTEELPSTKNDHSIEASGILLGKN